MQDNYESHADILLDLYRDYLRCETVEDLINRILFYDATGKEDDDFQDYLKDNNIL